MLLYTPYDLKSVYYWPIYKGKKKNWTPKLRLFKAMRIFFNFLVSFELWVVFTLVPQNNITVTLGKNGSWAMIN